MEFIADLHIHSYLSRATARNLDLEHLYLWAQLKGITVVATGDFTHPQWFSEIRNKLEPAEPGLFKLRDELAEVVSQEVPPQCRAPVRFLLNVEISSIYKKTGRVRKVHNIVHAPDLSVAEKINTRLARIGNIRSDGRPILGLDSKDLLETVLEISEDSFVVPAHIWTPWFSVFGSKSGFDSLEECFEELTPHIFAAETGLSSDPAMNWRVSKLDGITLVSNSDAHSPANLGREANLFDTDLSYFAIRDALKTGDPASFLGTIEFFPEEGKYHFDGHRKCGIRLSPEETMHHQGLCPLCGNPVTIGVMYRVEELADRKEGERPEKFHPFTSVLPLTDILSEVFRVGPKSKKVQTHYHRLLKELGPEFDILRKVPLKKIEEAGSPLLAEAIRRMRNQDVRIAPGYDGEFGKIRLFDDQERDKFTNQHTLFQVSSPKKKTSNKNSPPSPPSNSNAAEARNSLSTLGGERAGVRGEGLNTLNPAQKEAVQHAGSPLLIVAGPGTGKTRTITYRIAYLLSQGIARPDHVLAVTFTNKAAEEMRDRLRSLIKDRDTLSRVTIKTFHALCLDIIRREGEKERFAILGDDERARLIKMITPHDCEPGAVSDAISKAKQYLLSAEDNWDKIISHVPQNLFGDIYARYQQTLDENLLLDFEDLIFKVARLFEDNESIRKKYQERFSFISVDEYQDINYAQYRLIQLLAPNDKDLCVIGDPDQAIYGFRGSDVHYFYKFQEDYPSATVIRLDRNYRSTETILKASTQVIAHHNVKDRLWSGIHGDQWLTISRLPSEKAEAEFVIKTIETQVGGISHFSIESRKMSSSTEKKERGFSDFAVLYRINAQGKVLEEAFARSGIPYQRIGKERLADRKGIAELISCLRMLEWTKGPSSTSLTSPGQLGFQGLSKRDIQRIEANVKGLKQTLEGKGVQEKIKEIIKRIDYFRTLSKEKEFNENLRHLLSFAGDYGSSISDFLAHLALQSETDLYDPRAEKVTLMTLHAAKGLEFPVVFITGCEEGLIPYQRNKDEVPDIAEERRLFYVGLTRAKEKLFLTHTKKRLLFGTRSTPAPSPFLKDIERDLKKHESPFLGKKRADVQLSLFK